MNPQPEISTIPRKKPEKPTKKRRAGTNVPEVRQAAVKLASLAIAWMKQDHILRVRQREELRRAFAVAAESRAWTSAGPDRIGSAVKDIKALTKAGSQFIADELAKELANKKTEMTRLKKMAQSIYKMADTEDFEDPIEVSYSHTAREGDGMGTRTVDLVLADAGEARDAAAAIEKKLDSWEKLRDLMLDDLKKKQRRVAEMELIIPEFAESSRSVVDDVLAILH